MTTLRQKLKQPEMQMRIGLVFLILASLSRWFLGPPHALLAEGLADGLTGALYGMSIGLLLLGIARKKRRSG